jgi:hypothetical protein
MRKVIPPLLVIALLIGTPAQLLAVDGLFSRKLYGAVSAGVGTFLLIEANKARTDASDAYSLYEIASSPATARDFYNTSREQDTKAAILLALGVGSIGYGLHMFFKRDAKLPDPEMDSGLAEVKGVRVDVGGDPRSGRVGLSLRRGF